MTHCHSTLFGLICLISALDVSADGCLDRCCPPERDTCCCQEPPLPLFCCVDKNCGVTLSAEFLYWYCKETNLPYAAEVLAKMAGNTVSTRDSIGLIQCTYHLNGTWKPGFRIGAGWQDPCTSWDGLLTWTYLDTDSSTHTSTSFQGQSPTLLGQSALLNPFPQRSLTAAPFFDTMGAKWTLQLNQIDLVMGRQFLIDGYFALRPFTGLRGAWTRTRLTVKGVAGPKPLDADRADVFQQSRDAFYNRFWAVGLVAGLEPSWYFLPCLSLYGLLDGSVLWGEHEQRKEDRFFSSLTDATTGEEHIAINVSNRYGESTYQMAGLVDLAIGFRWENSCCNTLLITLDVSWEHHIWLSHSERLRTYSQGEDATQVTQFDMQVSDLGYGGPTLRLRFDF